MGRGVADGPQTSYSSHFNIPNFVAVSQTISACVRGPKNLGDAGVCPLGTGAWLTLRNTLLPNVCNHSKFCHCKSNHLGIGRGSQFWGRWGSAPWDGGLGWPTESCFSPCLYYHAKFYVKLYEHKYGYPSEKFDPCIPLSRSLKVLGTDIDRSATYDFLLMIHSNHGPISYCFRDRSDIYKILTSHVFNTAAEGFPLKFCNCAGAQKTRAMSRPDRRENVTICPLDTGRTDGFAITISHSACIAWLLTCDKKPITDFIYLYIYVYFYDSTDFVDCELEARQKFC